MQKLLLYFTIFVFVSILAISIIGFTNVALAEELTNLRDEMAYGYDAMLERQEERERAKQFQQYQQKEYRQQQQTINRLDMYNQARHQTGHVTSQPY
ncbi:hypothetical protein MCAMS1_01949 [biofilm metagenome]